MIPRIAILGAFLAATIAANAVEIVRVWTEWRDDASFIRLSELAGGGENPGTEIFLRTHPEVRDGMYFLVRLRKAEAADLVFHIQVIMPGGADPVGFRFPAKVRKGSSVYQLGLTGPDWPGAETHPIAWRVALLGKEEAELGSVESFLWRAAK